ncbi:hypothetical protein CAL7102_07839 [Dulcicalothrix desertica PCC 7102]|nr:hypothetical protein CAL7102_07839 [Dulcicalothrix desertica PCC 7102]
MLSQHLFNDKDDTFICGNGKFIVVFEKYYTSTRSYVSGTPATDPRIGRHDPIVERLFFLMIVEKCCIPIYT